MSGPTQQPSTTSVVRLVAAREVRERLVAKSFWILTALLVVLILAGGVISRVASDDGPGTLTVGVAGDVPQSIEDQLVATAPLFDRDVEVSPLDSADAARTALEDGDIDVAIVPHDGEALFESEVDQQVLALVQQSWSASQTRAALEAEGLSESQIASALRPEPLRAATVDDDGDGAEGLAVGVGSAAAILLFISVQTFGGYVLTGVVEEKSTAVVELLLVRARSDQLLAGKVIGIGIAAMAQFAAAVLASLVSLTISDADIPSDVWSSVPMVLVWFLGGYALYSTLFAVAGALVSRQEDAQAAAAPITSVLIIAYMLVFFFGYVPESTASRVLSVLPPMAPLLMPMRMAAGAASIVEIVLAVVLLFGSVLVAWKVTGRIYEQVVLQRGTRISWRHAASLVRRA